MRNVTILTAVILLSVVAGACASGLPVDMRGGGDSGALSLRLSDAEFATLLDDDEGVTWNETSEFDGAPRRWWPLLLSAVLPGLGEVTTGHLRGYPMMAVDAGLWWGAKSKHDDGNEFEDEFEAFALEHWSEAEWVNALAAADQNNLDIFFPEYELAAGSTPSDVPLYVSRELDEREWFENLGKWDVFAWGWREYWDADWNDANNFDVTGFDVYIPSKTDPSNNFFSDNPTMTPLRKDYIGMREKSDDAFVARDRFMSVALLLRVVSVLQVTYLEGFIGGRFDAPSEGQPSAVRLFAQPSHRDAAQIGWKVSF